MAGGQLKNQWFPVYVSGQGTFQLNGQPSGAIGARARAEITLDTFPYLIYGARFEISYELPAAYWIVPANQNYKQLMREGGVEDDYDVEIQLTQGNVTTNQPAHVRNLQGGLSINKHPWPLFYPARGGNRITMIATRNSSFAPVRVADVDQALTILWKVTLETSRGIRNVADGVTSPTPPPSTGYP